MTSVLQNVLFTLDSYYGVAIKVNLIMMSLLTMPTCFCKWREKMLLKILQNQEQFLLVF